MSNTSENGSDGRGSASAVEGAAEKVIKRGTKATEAKGGKGKKKATKAGMIILIIWLAAMRRNIVKYAKTF